MFKRLMTPTTRCVASRAVRARTMATKRQATPLGTFYKLAMKRTSSYMFFILFGTIMMETVGNGVLDTAWRLNNRGVSYKHSSIRWCIWGEKCRLRVIVDWTGGAVSRFDFAILYSCISTLDGWITALSCHRCHAGGYWLQVLGDSMWTVNRDACVLLYTFWVSYSVYVNPLSYYSRILCGMVVYWLTGVAMFTHLGWKQFRVLD